MLHPGTSLATGPAIYWSDVTSQTSRPVCRLGPALGWNYSENGVRTRQKTRIDKLYFNNFFLQTNQLKVTNIFRVKKLTHLLSSQCQLRPGRETENWQVSADLTCHPQLLWRIEDNKFVSALQCVCMCQCRQCVDIVVLTDDNVPMLDNQCYTPIISCVPPSAGSFTQTSHIRSSDLRWHEDTERGRWLTEADFLPLNWHQELCG